LYLDGIFFSAGNVGFYALGDYCTIRIPAFTLVLVFMASSFRWFFGGLLLAFFGRLGLLSHGATAGFYVRLGFHGFLLFAFISLAVV
jgi:hypothetical protein